MTVLDLAVEKTGYVYYYDNHDPPSKKWVHMEAVPLLHNDHTERLHCGGQRIINFPRFTRSGTHAENMNDRTRDSTRYSHTIPL